MTRIKASAARYPLPNPTLSLTASKVEAFCVVTSVSKDVLGYEL